MTDQDLRGPLEDVRSFLAQIDNTVDPVARQAGSVANGGGGTHPQTRNDSNGVRSSAKHLPYNGGTSASAEGIRRGQLGQGRGPSSKRMQADQLRKLTRKWAIPIIVVTILGAAASYLISRRLTPTYAATGKVLVVAGPGQSGGSGDDQYQRYRGDDHRGFTSDRAVLAAASDLDAPPGHDGRQSLQGRHGDRRDVTPSSSTSRSKTHQPAAPRRSLNTLMKAYVLQVSQDQRSRIKQAGADIQNLIKVWQVQDSTRITNYWPPCSGLAKTRRQRETPSRLTRRC